MPADPATQASDLTNLSIAQLRAISEDFRHPIEVQESARNLIDKVAQANLQAAVAVFESRTEVFTDLTNDFVALTSLARKTPGGDAVAVLTPVLRSLGSLVTQLADIPAELVVSAATAEVTELPAQKLLGDEVPALGTASTSRELKEIAGEYAAMFEAADIDKARLTAVQKLARMLVSFRPSYEKLQSTLGIPWFFVGLIHCLEGNFNFGTHLHNGDSLMHRTVRVPRGRPTVAVADPPFAWETSAIDALTLHGFQTHTDWSLPAILFRLEKYNGFGYRSRGIASPYLWSFSDRYVKGKFVADGVFDPAAVSRQCGAAVILKQLVMSKAVVLT